ncbi:MAG: hypothetical protein M1815_003330 [Lichina confinis]|nr:MAG: hypothetical protein M1815_003330 [Lichina confinis]
MSACKRYWYMPMWLDMAISFQIIAYQTVDAIMKAVECFRWMRADEESRRRSHWKLRKVGPLSGLVVPEPAKVTTGSAPSDFLTAIRGVCSDFKEVTRVFEEIGRAQCLCSELVEDNGRLDEANERLFQDDANLQKNNARVFLDISEAYVHSLRALEKSGNAYIRISELYGDAINAFSLAITAFEHIAESLGEEPKHIGTAVHSPSQPPTEESKSAYVRQIEQGKAAGRS